MTTTAVNWPENIPIGRDGYKTPDGVFPRVTSILKVIGGDKVEGLIRWAATEERKAAFEAVVKTFDDMDNAAEWTGEEFCAAVESALGPARSHQKLMNKAADIGTTIHQEIHARMVTALPTPPSKLQPEVVQALEAFERWWDEQGLKYVRSEQPVWDAELGYAGTIDLIVEHPIQGIGIVDFKTGKGIYDEHHIQVAAYMHAASRWADVRWAHILRLPKVVGDPDFEAKPLGAMYNRQLDRDQLMEVFKAALTIHRLLVAK